jgi:hypothetical protein
MSYIGANPSQQITTPAIDYFSGNGVATTFTLTRSVTSVFSVEVVVNGVEQNPRTAYSINQAGNLVFDGAPSAGTNNIYVMYNSQVGQFVTPSPGTVGTSALSQITNISSGASNLTLQTGAGNTTALTVDQNQNVNINNPNYSLAKLHVSLTDRVRNTTLMNANNTNTLAVLSAPFGSPELTVNAGAKWGMLFHGNGDFNTTPAGLATATKSAGVFAVSEDTGAGYNRQVGLALHTCASDQGHREAMRVSGNGFVTAPLQPCFFYNTCNPVAQTSGSSTPRYTVAVTANSAYSTTTGFYTAPVTGVYVFSWCYLMQNIATDTFVDDGWLYNGLFYYGGERRRASSPVTGGDGYYSVKQTVVLRLNAGDYFAPQSNHQDTSWNFYSDRPWGHISGTLIG